MPASQAEDEHSEHSRVDGRENDSDSETEPESEDEGAHREWEKRNQRGGDLVNNRRDSSEKDHDRGEDLVDKRCDSLEKNHNPEGDHYLRGKENNQPIAREQRPVAKKANPPKLNLAALAMIHRPLTTAQTAQKRVFIHSNC